MAGIVLMSIGVLGICLAVIITIVNIVYGLKKKRKHSNSILLVRVQNITITLDMAKIKNNIPLLFEKLDYILTAMKNRMNDSDEYNSELSKKLLELKTFLNTYTYMETTQLNGEQISRGQKKTAVDYLLPSLQDLP